MTNDRPRSTAGMTGSAPNRGFVPRTVRRVGTATGTVVLLPFRAAARTPLVRDRAERLVETGRDVSTDMRQRLEVAAVEVLETPDVKRAIDRALAGPLPETIARSIVEHRVLERVVSEMVARGELDALVASTVEDSRTDELVSRLTQSPAFHTLLANTLSSPQVRKALTQQTTSFAGEIGRGLRERAKRVDRKAHTGDAAPVPYAGFATRGIGLAADALIVDFVYLVGAAFVALVASLFGRIHHHQSLVGSLAGAAWLIVVFAYFAGFWATAGQTPGMRLMRLRVQARSGASPGIVRSLVRVVGLALAIIPLFAGFLPVFFDRRRRALQDFIASTVVVYDDNAAAARSSREDDVVPVDHLDDAVSGARGHAVTE